MTVWNVELTDTFGGEANYAWVRRAEVTGESRRQVMRRAKSAVGMSGVRGKTFDHGDMLEFRPYGLLQVMFVVWAD